jgi:c-di-GMP-binding flagellar brake protein YcgR
MERRKHGRIAHKSVYTIPVTFSGEAKGAGTLCDLSPGGCKVDSRTTPPLGASLTLRLAVSHKSEPVKIDAAVVGWTIKDKYFGVKFLDVKPMERLALERYLDSLAASPHGSCRL